MKWCRVLLDSEMLVLKTSVFINDKIAMLSSVMFAEFTYYGMVR